MPTLKTPLEALSAADLGTVLDAADTLTRYRQYIPRSGMLVMLIGRFRDDTREVFGKPPERQPGVPFASLDEMTTSELNAVTSAVDTLLAFTGAMDDPELPAGLRMYQGELKAQADERAAIRADKAS
jgi:hypothetical protein